MDDYQRNWTQTKPMKEVILDRLLQSSDKLAQRDMTITGLTERITGYVVDERKHGIEVRELEHKNEELNQWNDELVVKQETLQHDVLKITKSRDYYRTKANGGSKKDLTPTS